MTLSIELPSLDILQEFEIITDLCQCWQRLAMIPQ